MAEYMVKVNATGAGSIAVPINKRVLGVYSNAAVKVGWDFNGEKADITPVAATVWEPHNPFEPGPTSKLIITTTAAATVLIRME